MKSKMFRFNVVFAMVALLTLAPLGFAQKLQNRLSRAYAYASADSAELPNTASRRAATSVVRGALSADTPLTSMTLALKPSAAQTAALDELLANQQDPSSPLFHKWLTPAEFGERFGISDSDLTILKEWLANQGFQVTDVAPSRNAITFAGTSGTVERAFGVSMQRMSRGGKEFFENEGNVRVPAAFADVVRSVRGLSSYRLQPHAILTKAAAADVVSTGGKLTPNYTTSSGSHFLVPYDFRQIYGFGTSSALSAFNGSGIKIGVIGQSAIDTSQISFFQTLTGQAPKAPTIVLVPNTGTSTPYPGDEGESEIDVEYASGTAPGATVLFIYTGNSSTADVTTALQYAITQNLAPVLTLSYGGCELDNALFGGLALEDSLRQGNAQGQTILVSSGDSNAAGCDATRIGSTSVATQGATVEYPASSPNVTGVGGTRFNEGTASATYWATTNNSQAGSALGYIPEVVWNDTVSGGDLSGTGGGASQVFGKPTWQTGVGVPADGRRDVPDVAFSSSSAHDGYLFCSAEATAEKCTATAFSGYIVGGTSLAAPNFAAMLAVVEQKNGSTGYGNLNRQLYAIRATTPAVFHDVVTGDNKVVCQVGTADCTTGTFGYSAGVGYDPTTGLGSIDGSALATALASLASQAAQPTLLISQSPYQATTGTPATFTARVVGAQAFVPTGTITFTVDGVVGAPITLTASNYNSAFANSIAQTFGTTGSHSVSAAYSGNGTYSAATASFTFNVLAPITGAFTVGATPATLTITRGSNGTETATVTSTGGFTDTVNLEINASASIPSGVTFCYSPVSVVVPANGTITASVPLFTSATACANALITKQVTVVSGAVSSTGRTRMGGIAGSIGLAFLLFTGFGLRGSRKLRGMTLAVVLSIGALAAMGCGSSGSSTAAGTGSNTLSLVLVGRSSRNLNNAKSAAFTVVLQ